MSKWAEWKKNQGESRPWHLLEPSKLLDDKKVINERLNLCLSCPEFISLTTQCKKCGCFMEAKIKLQNAKCPLEKW